MKSVLRMKLTVSEKAISSEEVELEESEGLKIISKST